MLYAETDRLYVRSLEKGELQHLVALIDTWDVIRWLSVVPYPYTMKMAEEFYAEMKAADDAGEPQFYALAKKADNVFMGGIGIHPPRGSNAVEGDVEIGYWLGLPYWGNGFMTEGALVVRDIAFQRPKTRALIATTSLSNVASQKILKHLGMRQMGAAARDYDALRGDDEALYWRLTRPHWEESRTNA